MKDIVDGKYILEHQEEILKLADIVPSCIMKYIPYNQIKKYFEYNRKNHESFKKEYSTVDDWLESEKLVLNWGHPEEIVELLEDWVDCFPQFKDVLNEENFEEYIDNEGVLDQSEELNEVEKRFHEVIMGRAGNLIEHFEIPLPHITLDLLKNTDWRAPESFPIPGMYGGFYYFLTVENCDYVLYADSWSRICEGSGQTHRITADDWELIDEGFV